VLACLADLTPDTIAGLRIRVDTVDTDTVELTLLRPGTDLGTETAVGTLEIDLTTGAITGNVPDLDAEVADTLKLAVEPGDVVTEPNLGLLVVTGVSTDGLRLNMTGASVSTGNIRRVGSIDLETLDLD
jgi:hypothetical protein